MRYVIALGGNALVEPKSADKVACEIVRQHALGNQIIITHGNGPQVGELAATQKRGLAVLTAETQAWIGTVLKEKLNSALLHRGMSPEGVVEIVLTDVIVKADDLDFKYPTKPIGPFMSVAEAASARRKGLCIRKLIGGYRRVVPSPEPLEIMQMDAIKYLLGRHRIVIACGGGGIPVARSGKGLKYTDAVIDKDSASSILASAIRADMLFILTNVDGAYMNYTKRNRELISKSTAKALKASMTQGHFEAGSMMPKVKACIDFAESTGKCAGIGSLSHPRDVLSMKRLTLVTP